MSLIVKENKESTREPVPAGMAHGICYGVIDLGTQPGNPALMIKAARKVIIMFELPDERFDFENLLGVNGLLNIIHEHRNSKTYANISSISPLMKGHPKKAPENPTVFY